MMQVDRKSPTGCGLPYQPSCATIADGQVADDSTPTPKRSRNWIAAAGVAPSSRFQNSISTRTSSAMSTSPVTLPRDLTRMAWMRAASVPGALSRSGQTASPDCVRPLPM